MAEIVVTGGGICGLGTAMLLARDGHHVTVVERDPAPPPAVDEAAWAWERRGVNQFRLLHFLLPRVRRILEDELPEVADMLEAGGAVRYSPFDAMPESVSGGRRPGDEEHVSLTARRPVAEAAIARVAGSTAGLTVRRGTAVAGLRTGTPAAPGVPLVTGVVLDDGEELAADLVVDATGRRSPLPAWLAAVGGGQPVEEREDCGFVYYGRHLRGELPVPFGPLLQHLGSVSVLTLPADNGTWGVGFVVSAHDREMRRLKDPATWDRALAACPLVAHWGAGEPIDDGVAVMAGIEDRIRHYVVDGRPAAAGVVAVADSWSCTNPSVGRGISIGLLHGVALRDLLRRQPLDDPVATVLEWDETTRRVVEPFYRATLAFDRGRLAEMEALVTGAEHEPHPVYAATRALEHAMGADPDLLRVALDVVGAFRTIDDVLADADLRARIAAAGAGWRDAEVPGPDRAAILDIVSV